jgi:hypothetical protein
MASSAMRLVLSEQKRPHRQRGRTHQRDDAASVMLPSWSLSPSVQFRHCDQISISPLTRANNRTHAPFVKHENHTKHFVVHILRFHA